MADLDPALVEKCAKARWRTVCKELDLDTEAAVYITGDDWSQFIPEVKETLLATGIPAAALNALAKGEAVVVPKVRTREMCDARQAAHGFEPLNDEAWSRLQEGTFAQQEWAAMLAASPYRSDT